MIDNFSNFEWTVPIRNKNAQTIKDSFENIIVNSKRKPNLIESDRGKELYKKVSQDFLNKNNIKLYSRNTDFSAVLQENLIVLSEIFLNDLFLKRVMVIGLMF